MAKLADIPGRKKARAYVALPRGGSFFIARIDEGARGYQEETWRGVFRRYDEALRIVGALNKSANMRASRRAQLVRTALDFN